MSMNKIIIPIIGKKFWWALLIETVAGHGPVLVVVIGTQRSAPATFFDVNRSLRIPLEAFFAAETVIRFYRVAAFYGMGIQFDG